MTRVKRSCNADNVISDDGMTEEEALRASWAYWERRGYANPEKRESDKVQALQPKPEEYEQWITKT